MTRKKKRSKDASDGPGGTIVKLVTHLRSLGEDADDVLIEGAEIIEKIKSPNTNLHMTRTSTLLAYMMANEIKDPKFYELLMQEAASFYVRGYFKVQFPDDDERAERCFRYVLECVFGKVQEMFCERTLRDLHENWEAEAEQVTEDNAAHMREVGEKYDHEMSEVIISSNRNSGDVGREDAPPQEIVELIQMLGELLGKASAARKSKGSAALPSMKDFLEEDDDDDDGHYGYL